MSTMHDPSVSGSPEAVETLDAIALTPRMRDRSPLALPEPDTAPTAGAHTYNMRELIAVRESDMYEYALLDNMVRQIVEPLLPDDPSLARVLDYGAMVMRPGADGDAARQALGAVPLYATALRATAREGAKKVKRPIAWAFTHGDYRFVYGLVSAGKPATVGGTDNDWVLALAAELKACRPRKLRTGPFSRLVRNKDLAAPLRSVLLGLGTELCCAEHPSGFRVNDTSGAMIWDLLVSAAHADWIMTLTRLQMGTIYDLKQGRFPRGGDHPIPGIKQVFTGNGRKRTLAVDEDQRAQVRAIIDTAASGISATEAAAILGGVGLRSRTPVPKGVEPPLISDVSNQESAVQRLWQHLPTYLDGTYVYHHRNTIPGLTEMAGMPVHRRHDGDLGEFRFTLKFPVPDTGWHDADTIKAAIRRRLTPKPKSSGRAARGLNEKPLASISRYVRDGHEYRLLCDGPSYILRRRPAAAAGNGLVASAFGLYEGELVARFAAKSLHKAVAAILRSVPDGAPTETPCPRDVADIDLSDLQARADLETQTAVRMREIAATSSEPDESALYQRQARDHEMAARSLRRQILDAQAAVATTAGPLSVDLTQAIALAEILDRTYGETSRQVRNTAHSLIARMEFDAAPGHPLAEVRVWINLRASRGHIKIGPLAAPVVNTTRRRRTAASSVADRQVALIHTMLGDHADLTRAMEGLSQRDERRRLLSGLQELLPAKAAAGVLLDCPVTDVQRVALNPIFQAHGLDPLPITQELDPSWTREIEATYGRTDWTWPGVNWVRGNPNRLREIVTWIARHAGPTGVTVDELRRKIAVEDTTLYSLLNSDPTRYASSRWTVAPLERTAEWPSRRPMPAAERRVRVPICQTCDEPATPHLLAVPELPEGWLCARCRTAPGTTTVYPAAYLRPWVGGAQGSRRIRAEGVAQYEWIGTHEEPFTTPPRRGTGPG